MVRNFTNNEKKIKKRPKPHSTKITELQDIPARDCCCFETTFTVIIFELRMKLAFSNSDHPRQNIAVEKDRRHLLCGSHDFIIKFGLLRVLRLDSCFFYLFRCSIFNNE